MSLEPVPGPLSIAAGTVIVEVLVGWSPALPLRSLPPRSDLVSVRISSTLKKKKERKYVLKYIKGELYILKLK